MRKNQEEHHGGGENGKVYEDIVENIVVAVSQSYQDVDDNNQQADHRNKYTSLHHRIIAPANKLQGEFISKNFFVNLIYSYANNKPAYGSRAAIEGERVANPEHTKLFYAG